MLTQTASPHPLAIESGKIQNSAIAKEGSEGKVKYYHYVRI